MAMLEGKAQLSMELLNQATQAWIEQEYHRSAHAEIGTTPLAHFLAGLSVARPAPGMETLRAALYIEVQRRQRHSDGTVSLEGRRWEIPNAYRHLRDVYLRYARWGLSRVDLLDGHSGAPLCAVYPLDKATNADGLRRALQPTGPDLSPRVPTTMAPLLRQLLAEHAATGLPPAFLPTPPPATADGNESTPTSSRTSS